MLVLTRKNQEEICIGDDIRITVLKIKGKSVRIGIEAPANQSVLRGEIRKRDQERAREVAESAPISGRGLATLHRALPELTENSANHTDCREQQELPSSRYSEILLQPNSTPKQAGETASPRRWTEEQASPEPEYRVYSGVISK